MADVKWIKMSTDIFDNRKIRQIESLPDGNAIIVVWIKLLCLAGNINDNGFIYITDEIPYTEQTLSTQFNTPIAVIQLAMKTFEQFGMIEVIDDILHISNWEKYQNIEGMEKIRDQNRIRKQRQRKRERQLSRDSHVTVTVSHATDIDIDKNRLEEDKKEIKNSKKKNTKEKVPKSKYGEYQNVELTDDEYNKLVADKGIEFINKAIEYLDLYIEEKGTKYKSHYLTMRRWVFDAVEKQEVKNKSFGNYKAPTQSNQFQNDLVDWIAEEEKARGITQ